MFVKGRRIRVALLEKQMATTPALIILLSSAVLMMWCVRTVFSASVLWQLLQMPVSLTSGPVSWFY